MLDFSYYNPTRIFFGKSALDNLAPLAAGRRVLMVYGGGSVKKSGLYDKVAAALSGAAFCCELSGVVANPRLSLVYDGIALCRQNSIDLVLAVGGGSVIDTAKAVAAGAVTDGDIWEYYMDNSRKVPGALPVGVVLTIPAAGSESSDGSVITNEKTQMKRYINSEHIIPKFAIMNPEVCYTLPAYQTACGAADIIAHLMERYFTPADDTDFTDRLIEGAIRTMLYYTPVAVENPTNYDARAQIMWCGTLAHNGLLDTGRLGDWASHDIEHELSAIYDIAHGAGLAIIFPAWMRYVHKKNMHRFLQFAQRVFDVDLAADKSEETVLLMISRLEAFFASVGLPTRLSMAGITEEHFSDMAKKCVVGRATVGQLEKLGEKDILEIYKLAK